MLQSTAAMGSDTITHVDVIQEEPEEDLEDDDDDGYNDSYLDDFEFQEKIIIPSPKVSIDENDIPIIVNNKVKHQYQMYFFFYKLSFTELIRNYYYFSS